jgi:hypothetical protein
MIKEFEAENGSQQTASATGSGLHALRHARFRESD